MATDSNPYAPPASVEVLAKPRSVKGSLPIAAVSAAVAVAFIGFTILLLTSSPGSADRKGGMMFMFNIPALVGLVIASTRSTRIGVRFGAAAVCVQGVIMGAMLLIPVGMPIPILTINCAVIVPLLAVSTWAWLHDRRYSVFPEAEQDRTEAV